MSDNKNSSSQEKPEIKLNKKMRMWHKYRAYVIGAIAVIAVVFVCVGVIKLVGGNSNNTTAGNETSAAQTVAQETHAEQTTKAEETTAEESSTQETAAQAPASYYQVSGKAEKQDFTSKDYYSESVFLGDSIMDGISYYKFLDKTKVISDGNMTTQKAKDYVSSVASANPSKVFIMVGLNDINFGTKSSDKIVEDVLDVAAKVKTSAPSASVYVLSIMPVTQDFEAKSTTHVKQSVVDEVNEKLMTKAAESQVGFVDVASAYKDGTGYMSGTYTGNGSNIYNEYYPFLLNGIAGAVK